MCPVEAAFVWILIEVSHESCHVYWSTETSLDRDTGVQMPQRRHQAGKQGAEMKFKHKPLSF